ncbi:MAG: helix-turn-helix domain-containing protein [Gemmataceae bacterium]|nr:helix-turn-helix domain-containing protein [Gemmataceae bacterium]
MVSVLRQEGEQLVGSTLDALLRTREAARRLTISERHLKRLVATGRLPAPIKFSSRCVRWLVADLDAYIVKRVADRRQQVEV